MINPQNRNITIDSPSMVISPNMRREEFLQSAVANISTPVVENAPWSSYNFKPVTIGGESFAANIYFDAGRLDSIQLGVIRPEFGSSWADWSKERQLAKKPFHDSLLESWLGTDWRKRRFAWGEVGSEFDPKGGSSSIIVRYAA